MAAQIEIPLYHKGKIVFTTVGCTEHEVMASQIVLGGKTENFIPAGYDHRPDLIANLFLGDVTSWWAILEMNGIFDPFEGLKVGERVVLP